MATATLALDIRRIELAEAHSKAGRPAVALRILLDRRCAACGTAVPPETAEDLMAAERGYPVHCHPCAATADAARGILD